MTVEALKDKISSLCGNAVYDETGEWLQVEIPSGEWPEVAAALKGDREAAFDFLFCLTCVDWKTHLTMVYHLTSTMFRHNIVVKCKLDVQQPSIGTVSSIWRTADFHEREVYEMFGVDFAGHPDLRLLILPDGWEGKNPLRKDFDDPVNMIRL